MRHFAFTYSSWPSIRYDMWSYFNVLSKADIGQLNLQHGTKLKKVEKRKKIKSKKRIYTTFFTITIFFTTCSEVSVNSPGNPWNQSWRRKEGNGLRWEGFAEKERLSLEWKHWGGKSDWVMKEWGGCHKAVAPRCNFVSILPCFILYYDHILPFPTHVLSHFKFFQPSFFLYCQPVNSLFVLSWLLQC